MADLQFTVFSLPLILTAVICLLMAWVMWRRRPGVGVIPFVVLNLGVVEWCLANALEFMAQSFEAKVFLRNLSYIGITTAPAAWLVFALDYTGREKWVTRRSVALLFIEPVLVLIAAFTNGSHALFFSNITLDTATPVPALDITFGPAFWLHGVYTYSVMLAGTFLLLHAAVSAPRIYRQQYSMLLVASLAPWVPNALFIFNISSSFLDPTPFAFTIAGLVMAWSIYRYRLMAIVPVARATVIEHMSDAIMVLDQQNRIVDINPAALQIIGEPSPSAVVGQPAREVLAGFAPLVEQYRDVTDAETEIALDRVGEQQHYALRISPLKNRQGDLTGRLFVMHEITALKRAAAQIQAQNEALTRINLELALAREEAEESSRLKSEFLATMSHELRTPLNSVIGYTDLMLSGLAGEFTDKQRDYLRRVMSNGERLLAQINDILDISKIEAGRLELMPRSFRPADLMRVVAAQMQPLADKQSLQLTTHIDPALPEQLEGDQQRLEQILVNLVGNAIRFTEAGAVGIRFERAEEAQWAISVCDTGIGIPPHALEFIFDEFRQVDGSMQRQHGGTGMGLAIVRKLTMLMEGTVQVQSEVGKGSTFRVQLPLTVPEAQPVSE